MKLIPNGRGREIAAASVPQLIAGTMVSTDLVAARRFYEEFLGFDCVRYAEHRMLIRDRESKLAMESGSPEFFVIDVQEVPDIPHPQRWLNHWGLSVATTQEVDRIHERATQLKEDYGLQRVRSITNIHGAYGFYFADRDMNWWEIECRLHGMSNNDVFRKGDFVAPGSSP
jgi:catechol 2,3-dioxygenase-like lactoylglutathione lyase family enzyme